MKHLGWIALVATALVFPCSSAVAQELVVNGGFETGDFTGWTQFGDGGFTGVTDVNGFGIPPHGGTFLSYYGPTGAIGGITQTVATTAGQTYNLSYWLQNLGGTPNEFQLSWEGNLVNDIVNAPGDTDWVNYTATLTATVSGSTLSFGFFDPPSYILMDDVSLMGASVPEPTTWALFGGSGLLVTGGYYWRRLRARKVRGFTTKK